MSREELLAGRETAGPLVSVVVPTYNYGRFIEQALESLRAQTYPNWECVVVDDGSTDDTAEVVGRFAEREPRVRYIRQPNQRQSVARNTGITESRGAYFQFLDADDLIEPLKFERQVAYLESHPDVDIVYSGVRFFSTEEPGQRLRSIHGLEPDWMPEVSGAGREILPVLVAGNIMVINSPLVRRSLVERVGPFDPVLPPSEDWEYWVRGALADASFRFEDGEGLRALVRFHSSSSSHGQAGMYRAMLRMRRKLDARFAAHPELRRRNRDLLAFEESELGLKEHDEGNRLRAARHLVVAAATERRSKWRLKLLACALCAPFVSRGRLRALAATPVKRTRKGPG